MLYHLGRLLVRRAWLVCAIAGLAVIVTGLLGSSVFSSLSTGGFDDPGSESSRARELVDSRFGGSGNLLFLVRARTGGVDAPAVAADGIRLTSRLTRDERLSGVTSYWSGRPSALRSTDGADALIIAHLSGDERTRARNAAAVLSHYRHLDTGTTTVLIGGSEGTGIGRQVAIDLGVAESIAVPITLLLLVLAFGSLLAAALPLIVAALAILTTFAGLSLLSHVTSISIFAVNLATALGLGLGVDYCLLMVGRFREELTLGRDVPEAVATTLATAGRSILFSALIVSVALSAMLVFPAYLLRSFAYAGVGVTLAAMVAALVVLPSLLALLGPRINAGRVPVLKPIGVEPSRFWRRTATVVWRHPLRTGIPALGILLVLAAPLIGVRFATPDARSLPPEAPAHRLADVLQAHFSTQPTTIDVLVTSLHGRAGSLTRYISRVSRIAGVQLALSSEGVYRNGARVAPPQVAGQGRRLVSKDIQRIELTTGSDPSSARAQRLVTELRAAAPPGGAHVLVGGSTAALIDARNTVAVRLPLATSIIALSTVLLLMLFTGSAVQPLRALIGNVLTLAASLGIGVWIFQNGNLENQLGFTPHPLDTSMPVLLFCIVFGLSMDYEVFLISRIKDIRDQGADIRTATVEGLSRAGRLVTTAALLLAVSFLAFATARVSFIQLLGVGAGAAILLDATLVRGVLVPMSMRLLGNRSWWLPTSLRHLRDRFDLTDARPAHDLKELECHDEQAVGLGRSSAAPSADHGV